MEEYYCNKYKKSCIDAIEINQCSYNTWDCCDCDNVNKKETKESNL